MAMQIRNIIGRPILKYKLPQYVGTVHGVKISRRKAEKNGLVLQKRVTLWFICNTKPRFFYKIVDIKLPYFVK